MYDLKSLILRLLILKCIIKFYYLITGGFSLLLKLLNQAWISIIKAQFDTEYSKVKLEGREGFLLFWVFFFFPCYPGPSHNITRMKCMYGNKEQFGTLEKEWRCQPRTVPLGKAAGVCSLLFICYWFM